MTTRSASASLLPMSLSASLVEPPEGRQVAAGGTHLAQLAVADEGEEEDEEGQLDGP